MKALTPNALRVLEHRYLRRDAQGRVVESPAECLARVARAIAAPEALWDARGEAFWRERFQEALEDLRFLPNSPTLMNAGARDAQLFACFVLPLEDTPDGLERTKRTMADVQRTGGGTGFSFAHLRPRAAGGEGPLAVLAELASVTDAVSQSGRRRGANMGVLDARHPDLLDFVRAKQRDGDLSSFNLSVGLPDAFFQALERDEPWPLGDPTTGRTTARPRARALLDEIARAAWATGDPGVLFLDALERGNPTPGQGRIEATNPCGEVPLLPNESCNLASIHLGRHLCTEGGRTVLDRDALARTARLVVRFLDDALEANAFPRPEMADVARRNRKIGVGVMGLAEAWIRLGLPYGSPEAVREAEALMAFLERETTAASVELAVERGVFPGFEGSRLAERGLRVRNATRTSIAPTGTISLIAGTTPGIEPLFGLAFRRRHVLGDETLDTVEPLLLERLEGLGVAGARVLAHVRVHGVLPAGPDVDETTRALFQTALEIPAEAHLTLQAAFQRHVDNAVSKTVNLPREATPADVAAVYRRAHALGLKGVTVFRHGSGRRQVVELGVA